MLIVDDNRDVADSTAVLLRMAGYHVQLAYDGKDALVAEAYACGLNETADNLLRRAETAPPGRELNAGGLIMRDENVRVTATLVNHPPITPSFAYRFDATDRSIVISGDTTPSDNLVKIARGADVLVHSVLYVPALDRLVARVPNATGLRASIMANQTSAEDAGRVAQAAGVRTLVLSHFVPADDPEVTDQMWIDAARTHFHGSVIVGKDLLEI